MAASVGALILVGLMAVALGAIAYPALMNATDGIESRPLRYATIGVGAVVALLAILAVIGTLLPEGL